MEHRFTRKELYDQVWSKPISHLVSELGTTTGILSALLRRADIPTPPSGYWMRKEFGKPVVQMALPPAPAGCSEPLLLDIEARGVGRRPKPVEVMAAPKFDPVSEPNVPAPPSEVPAPVALKPRPTKPTTMTREELYSAVWTTPMARLAEQYGISGNGLAKICDRENIPYPPRGYWAKHAVGKAPRASPMPKSDGSRSITIRPTPLPPPPIELPQEVKQQVDKARANESTILVQERLLRPHAVVASWLAEHEEKSGAPLECQSERAFLRSIAAHFDGRGIPAVILANFHLAPARLISWLRPKAPWQSSKPIRPSPTPSSTASSTTPTASR